MRHVPTMLPDDDVLVPPPRSLAIRKCEFQAWLKNAKPGARIEYHRGFLPMDLHWPSSPLGPRLRRELGAIAERARALAGEGRLHLIQERHACLDYSYLAVKARRRSRDPFKPHDRGVR
jgi:hypothetical protein